MARETLHVNPRVPGRLRQLDGLRGLAAFAVFLSHALGFAFISNTVVGRAVEFPLLRPLWDGAPAVTLFFVLSGFVLTLPYTGPTAKSIDALPFLIRRVFRLYPAYWAAIAIALALRELVFAPQAFAGLTPWANGLWRLPITAKTLLEHFAMIAPGMQTDAIDPVIWSLVTEMKVSLVFPAVLFVVGKTRRPVYAGAILAVLAACDIFFHVLGLFVIFFAGAFLAKYRQSIVEALGRSRAIRILLGCGGYLLYGSAWIFGFLPVEALRYTTAAGATIFVALFLASGSLERFGTLTPIEFLGDVSYSFYLIHLPMLLAIFSVLYPRTHSPWLCAMAGLVSSLLASWVLFKIVELPGQRLGRALSKKRMSW
jgi:peptidoglycan/LPS O-acetylase OafA/YrhL